MKNEILSNEIRNLTDVIKEQQELVLSHSGKIPQIEIDLLMGNVRKLYERLIELNKVEQVISPVEQLNRTIHHADELIAHVATPEEETQYPVETSSEIEIATSSIIAEEKALPEIRSEEKIIEATHSPEHIQPEALTANVNPPLNNETMIHQTELAGERSKEYIKPATKAPQMASLFDDHETVTVADKFKGSPSVYDRITASRQENSLAEKHLKNPVSDLKKSIGINEKFAFINDLFDGDLNSYNEAIDKLNSSENQQQALLLLENNLSGKYNWNGESESFLKLKNLIERRFIG